jgi:predicted RNase H-like HicB family nuclease
VSVRGRPVRKNIQEAIALHVEDLQERGEPLPDDQVEMVEVAA